MPRSSAARTAFSLVLGLISCSPGPGAGPGSSGGANNSGGSTISGGISAGGSGAGGAVAAGGQVVNIAGSAGDSNTAAGNQGRDPKTCEEAVKFRTYLGCEYYPTVLANVVSSVFDFAVVVANASDEVASVQVDGPNGFTTTASVPAHELVPIYLPWVDSLKGPSLSSTCTSSPLTGSVLAKGGAYRLQSSRPVAAYQFNPLEFRASGGPPGKVWSCMPGTSPLCECNSYSNDASLLLPKNALTSNYVAFTWRDQGNVASSKPAYVAITALVDATEVTVKVGPKGQLQAGPDGSGLTAVGPNEVLRFTLNRGDVAELVAAPMADLSGTQIQAGDNKPIQVMSGSPSATAPSDSVRSADHIEEVVFPAETVGRDYIVPVPTGPHTTPVLHVVRLYGHAKPAALTYFPAKPSGAPDSLMPGEVAEFQASSDFQVQGSEAFGVGSFLVGGQLLDPDAPAQNSAGDPSQSFLTTTAQYREKYVFLAPVDYESNFVDVVVPEGVTLTLDGRTVDLGAATVIAGRAADGTTPRAFRVLRAPLDAGPRQLGAHEILATAPVGIQVVGYGRFTSYQYPGGLNLNLISEPPVIIPR